MNKKLLAIAVAAGLAMPMAAMAELSVYGQGHVSLDFGDDGTDSSMNVSSNSSRVGFKGSMDLDNGMKAGFQAENEIRLDNQGSGTWNGRNTFASLGGGFGEVRIGNHDTPFKDIRSALDLFNDQVGDLRNFTRVGDIVVDTTPPTFAFTPSNRWDERLRNSILYISPKLGENFVIKAQYSTNNSNTSTATGVDANEDTAYSVGLTGKIGPIGLWLAYENYDFIGVGSATARDSADGMRVGLQYKGNGPLIVNFMYQSTSGDTVTVDATPAEKYDRDVMALGVGFKSGAALWKFQYAMADDVDAEGGSIEDSGAVMYGVGVDFALSKASTVYLAYAMTDNDDNSAYRVTGGGGHGDDIGTSINTSGVPQDPSSLSVGYIVKF